MIHRIWPPLSLPFRSKGMILSLTLSAKSLRSWLIFGMTRVLRWWFCQKVIEGQNWFEFSECRFKYWIPSLHGSIFDGWGISLSSPLLRPFHRNLRPLGIWQNWHLYEPMRPTLFLTLVHLLTEKFLHARPANSPPREEIQFFLLLHGRWERIVKPLRPPKFFDIESL